MYDFVFVDPLVGVFVGFLIIKSGFDIGLENIDYLMGSAPSLELMKKIRKKVRSVKSKNVKDIRSIKAHYVGNFIHVALKVIVKSTLSTKKSHDLGDKVRKALEQIEEVDKVFVHVDYR